MRSLEAWTDERTLVVLLAKTYPQVDVEERTVALAQTLATLAEENLLEFGAS